MHHLTVFVVLLGVSSAITHEVLDGPTDCPASTPLPNTTKLCPLSAPVDPEFASICHPGANGHAGGAENPVYRCPRVNYADGVFRCACCGAPLFYAAAKFGPPGDGWPAFHGNGSWISNGTYAKKGTSTVCTPGGSEVVCSNCGTHLGDYFPAGAQSSYSYYCVDGVCLLPPGAAPGHVCEPAPNGPTPSRMQAYKALRKMMRDRGTATAMTKLVEEIGNHDHSAHDEHHDE